mmetsp:Transcript_47667/g.95433  ORF Transcript_47667/g.95433 Transcript_47667/m.95433 type:complete len:161 (-) Transcript_47667:261-743(-)
MEMKGVSLLWAATLVSALALSVHGQIHHRALEQQLQGSFAAANGGDSRDAKWERAGRKAFVAKDNANGVDVADMGGVGKASKMADLRMWLDGKSAPDSGGPEPAAEAFLGELPYVLVIVGGGILIVVLVAVRVLKTHQPRVTSYFSPSYSKEVMKGANAR